MVLGVPMFKHITVITKWGFEFPWREKQLYAVSDSKLESNFEADNVNELCLGYFS